LNRDLAAPEPEQATRAGSERSTPRLGPLSLRVNFSWTLAGSVTYAGCQWGVLIAIARLGNPEMVGQFALALAITAPVIMLTNLQLRAVQATDARRQYEFGEYLGLRLIMTALALVLIAAIGLLAGYSRGVFLIIMLVALAKAFEAISDVVHGLLQQRERMDRIGKSQILKGMMSLLVAALILYLTGSLIFAIGAYAFVWLALLIGYDLRSAAMINELTYSNHIVPLRPTYNRARISHLVMLVAPLGLSAMLISLNTNIPRYFLEHQVGTFELGIFAAMAYLPVAGRVVVNSVGQAVSPRLSQHFANAERRQFVVLLLKMLGSATFIGVTALAIAITAGRTVLEFIYGPEYAAYHRTFVLVMVGGLSLYIASVLNYALISTRAFRIHLPIVASVSATVLVASALLITGYGIDGAAMAIIAGGLVQTGGSVVGICYALTHRRGAERRPG
jgi:O-antigen/teichoic acid export membrane protein